MKSRDTFLSIAVAMYPVSFFVLIYVENLSAAIEDNIPDISVICAHLFDLYVFRSVIIT